MKERYFFKNSRLFSDYYLKELLPNDPIWGIDVSEYFKKIKEIYERKKDVIESLNEPSLEDQFIRPILRVLGHKWEVQPSFKKFKKPDYSFYKTEEEKIDSELSKDYFGNAIAVGEVKRWGRPLDRKLKDEVDPFEVYSPSLQMERYLWLTEVKWGILTNGKFWRIYERNTSNKLDIYYEVDLVNILERGNLEDFKYFYLFFRKKAFPYFLNKVYEESIDYAQAIGEDLKSNVYKALRILANGFLQTPGNDLSIRNLQEIHDNSLIFLYRLLFILYAEAGGLLPLQNPRYRDSYSFYSIKNDVAKKIDRNEPIPILQKGYWSRVNVLCDLINNGSESYDISEDEFFVPPYNGGLFDPDKNKFLEENEVSDYFIVDVIDLLSRSTMKKEGGKAFVDYSSLDIRHLGSIYEGLLENKLEVAQEDMSAIKKGKKEIWIKTSKLGKRKEIDNVSSGQLYPVTDKGERKATGSYYTPDYIVKYIVENTIGPLIEDKKNKIEREEDLIDEILSLKILDPAMGSGHFLVEATDFIAKNLVEALGESPKEAEEEDILWARREVVEKCIYGVDLNPLAVELAKLSLWLSTVSKSKPLSFLDHHLRCGNSLIGARIKDLSEHPDVKEGKRKKKIDSQISTFEILFNEKLNTLLSNRKFIEELPSETVIQIKEKEKYEKKFRSDIRRFNQTANLWISIYYGNEIPEKKYIKVQDKLESYEEEWQQIVNEKWFQKALNIYKEKRFFHWELEFPEIFYFEDHEKENPGFDVVIANPPYLGEKGHKEIFREISGNPWGKKYYQGKMDILYFFFHRSLDLLKEKGIVSFITTNYYITAFGAYKLRKDFYNRTTILYLINFDELKIFPSSLGQHNMITILKKGNFDMKAKNCITKRTGIANSNMLFSIVNWQDELTDYFEVEQNDLYDTDEFYIRLQGVSSQGNNLIDTILNRMRSVSIPLGVIYNINTGIQTGADKVRKKHLNKYPELEKAGVKKGDGIFVLTKNEIEFLNLDSKEEEILRPWFKNSDIYRYCTSSIYSEKVFYLSRDFEIVSNKILKFLRTYKTILLKRREVQNGVIKWWHLQWPRDSKIFVSPKIIAPQRSPENTFSYNEIPWYASADVYFITQKDRSVQLKYILALLNSRLYYLWLYFKGKRKGETLELYQKPLSEIPIKRINQSEQKPFIYLINQILSITKDDDYLQNKTKQSKVKEYEQQIDQKVYELYELTPEEIKVVKEFKK